MSDKREKSIETPLSIRREQVIVVKEGCGLPWLIQEDTMDRATVDTKRSKVAKWYRFIIQRAGSWIKVFEDFRRTFFWRQIKAKIRTSNFEPSRFFHYAILFCKQCKSWTVLPICCKTLLSSAVPIVIPHITDFKTNEMYRVYIKILKKKERKLLQRCCKFKLLSFLVYQRKDRLNCTNIITFCFNQMSK